MTDFNPFINAVNEVIRRRADELRAAYDDHLAEQAAGVRCTGHCCRGIVIHGQSLELIQLRGRSEPVVDTDDERQKVRDYAFIGEMLIPLGEHMENPEHPEVKFPWLTHVYNCRHLQAGGDCGAYAARQKMCRDYPYGDSVCDAPRCTGLKRIGGPWDRWLRLLSLYRV